MRINDGDHAKDDDDDNSDDCNDCESMTDNPGQIENEFSVISGCINC